MSQHNNETKHIPGYRLNNEKRLIDDLFKNYQVKFGRPVNNMTEKVVVFFGIMLIQLIDLVNFNFGYIGEFFAKLKIFYISGRKKSSSYY